MQILAGIILLGVLITFHELGHFLFAKALGVRVLVFSVGFGPKIWGFTRGDTEYRLSVIPLGGYVRMFGDTLNDDELSAEEKKMSFLHQATWRKSLIAFAGPLFNFILPIVLFFFLFVGAESVLAPRVGTLVKGGEAETAGLKPGDLITEVLGQPVHTFSEVAETIASHPDQDLSIKLRREDAEGGQKDVEIIVRPEGKPSAMPLDGQKMVGRIGIMPSIELPIVAVVDNSPLKLAGINNADEIVAINGIAIDSKTALFSMLEKIRPGMKLDISTKTTSISLVAPENLAFVDDKADINVLSHLAEKDLPKDMDETIAKTKSILRAEMEELKKHFGLASANGLVIERELNRTASDIGLEINDRIVAIDGEALLSSLHLQQAITYKMAAPHVLGVIKADGEPSIVVFLLPSSLQDRVDLDKDLDNILGIKLAQVFSAGEIIERHVGIFEALRRACVQTYDIAVMTARSIWLLIKRELPASQLGGPLMVFDVAHQAAEKSLAHYIFIMCLLSVNLGLLNLLPIPALDGGHLLLFGIEAIQRKPLTVRTRTIATQIGVALLLMLMAYAIFNDLSRLFR